ncbi:MAG: efflux transporter outer membrane subunit [Rhodospirillaceae bacterium]
MRTTLSLAALAVSVSACSFVDEYLRPETPVPAAWSEAGTATSPAAWPAADWWRQFGSPALDAYMTQAEAANFDLAAAIARVRQADAQARISGASLLPALDLNAGAQRTQRPAQTPSSPNAKAIDKNTFSTSLAASYELDFWGKNAAALESAEAAAAASRFDQQTVALTVQSSVATSYFDSLGLQDRLGVARANVANAEGVLAAIRDRVRFGTATELDLAQQESIVAGLRAAVPPLEQQLRQNANTLAVLLGRLPEQVRIESGTLARVTVPVVTPGLPSELLERRPDVRFAEAQLIAANADIGAARAALFPSVKLTVEYGFESLALSTLLHSNSVLYTLASNLTQPIFHGGALKGERDLKQARYDELLLNYRKAVVSAFSDVENALNATRKTAEEEQAQRAAVTTAQRAYTIALAQFRAGLIDITTLLNTQKTLFAAEDALAQVRLGRIQAVVGLFKALGGGWHAPAKA